MSEQKIAKALGLRSLEEIDGEEENLPQIMDNEINLPSLTSLENEEVVKDIESARQNIKSMIAQGSNSLEELLKLAKQSESPRAFEVASGLMKTLLDANKDFVEMSMKKKYAKEETPAATQNNVTNNNLILSTADLLKMLKGDN